jgi:hypothetical protein
MRSCSSTRRYSRLLRRWRPACCGLGLSRLPSTPLFPASFDLVQLPVGSSNNVAIAAHPPEVRLRPPLHGLQE